MTLTTDDTAAPKGLFLVRTAALTACAALTFGCDGRPALEEYGLGSASTAVTAGRVLIKMNAGAQMSFGYDIKQPGKADDLTSARANEIFNIDGMDLIRVPIYGGAEGINAHPAEGSVDATKYADIVAATQRALQARPNLKVFASLKSGEGDDTPGWTKSNGALLPGKYGRLLMDYVQFMKSNNINVTFLGPANEAPGMGVRFGATEWAQTVENFNSRCANQTTVTCPEFVGNCSYNATTNGINFLTDLYAAGKFDLLGRASIHYYSAERTPSLKADFDTWVNEARFKPKWDTELHWGDETLTDFGDAKSALVAAFDEFDADFRRIIFWNYVPESVDTLRAHIMSSFVRHTNDAFPLETDDHDGPSYAVGKFNTKALKQGNDVTLLVVNDTADSYNARPVEIENRQFDPNVTYKTWTADSAGAPTTATATSYPRAGVVQIPIPAYSITMIRIPNVRL